MQLGSDGPVHRDTALCLSMVPPGRKSVFRAGFRGVRSAPLPGGGTGGLKTSTLTTGTVYPARVLGHLQPSLREGSDMQ
jgi:hypothetical protein